ncbi:hypothetical protein [Cecembia calidifontis]|uniref:Tetratricopeptide repeat protein n=1 Tax=Cecembia calidifontis TaxID=1187080 RepID=A0A4Q7PFP3_9BACT|nr:hypothetical protein [Cecembia calidifontis]RZS98500.1 hypothetical protein BC751_4157 [Cecembia calidifontis]
MSIHTGRQAEKIIFKGLPFMLSIIGGLLLLGSFFIWDDKIMPVIPGIFSESIKVPVNFYSIGSEIFSLEMDNFLIFQNFQSLPPLIFPQLSLIYGAIIWILFILGLSLVSTLKRMYFIVATGLTIFLFTFSGINGLNIGGLSSNTALIILLLGTVLPLVLISFFAVSWGLVQRFLVLLLISSLSLWGLVKNSGIENPWLWLSENVTFPAAIVTVLFLLHIGHAVISSITVLLIRLNKGTGIKIIWHLIVIFFLYFLLLVFTLLHLTGEVNIPFPTLPPLVLMLIAGFLGYGVLKLKIEQTDQYYDRPLIGKSFYWLGFAITAFTWAKADFTGNQPLFEFFNHSFIYGQIALSLLFFLYTLANFYEIINSGRDIEKVLFKPQFFAYFHMRIGAIMAMVILVIFADGVVGMQLSSFSTNISADYYYQSNRPLEAAILYENSWLQYRKNYKAKNAAAHLRFQLGNSNEAMEHLYQNFDYVPSVQSILLLSDKLHQQDKIFDAIFYLEKGLEIFPDNPYLLNNLALLYSKLNRPTDAYASLNSMKSELNVAKSNLLGLKVKHQARIEEGLEIVKDLPYQLNYLAHANRQGNFAPFVLPTQDLPENFVLKTALLRNQWSNQVISDYESDILLLDSLIGQQQMSFEERNYRETRILRTLQDNHINETLKYLNGTAATYPNSAAYYHALAAKVLAGQWDLGKASVDILVAYEKGFENFQPVHLAILYFGGKPIEAISIHQRFEVDFPEWMEWNESGKLKESPQVKFWTALGRFHEQLPEDLLVVLDQLGSETLQAEWALALMRHKLHAFDANGFKKIKDIILKQSNTGWTEASLNHWFDYVHGKQESLEASISQIFRPDLGLDRNAYWTPLVWKKLRETEDDMGRYALLQEAIQFNRDPILWILYVNQSRKVGLDNYAGTALSEMGQWLSPSQLERLQMQNYW